MKAYRYNGDLVWNNYDFSQFESSGRDLPGFTTDYCPDAIPVRVTLGLDNKLYMLAEGAGGNPIWRADPKDLKKTLASQGKWAGGDAFNSTDGANSGHMAFVMKYEQTGEILNQQNWVSKYPKPINPGLLVANSFRANDFSVSEDGVMSMVGGAASYLPDRDTVAQNINGQPVGVYSPYDAFYLEIGSDMRTRIRSLPFKKTGSGVLSSVASK